MRLVLLVASRLDSGPVAWGEWGPEHISVPGNACGLDLDDGIWAPRGGRILLPHNVDSIAQSHLLLAVFLFFADVLVVRQRLDELPGLTEQRVGSAPPADRAQFVRDNAVSLLAERDAKIARQKKIIKRQETSRTEMRKHIASLRERIGKLQQQVADAKD